jgi:putative flippase GtrA
MNLRTYYQGPFYSRIDKGQAIAYPVSGALVTASDYLAFALCFTVIGAGLLESTVIAYIVGLVISYLLNRYWVFKKGADKQAEGSSLWRYALFLAINLVITYVMLWAMENWFGINPYLGKVVVNFFMFFWIYLGNNYFVFRGIKTGPIQL